MNSQEQFGVILEHVGPVEFDTIGDLISLLKQRVSKLGIKQNVYKRLLSVMIESLENVYRYRDNYDCCKEILETFPPHFIINLSAEGFIISSSNPILNKHIPDLEKRLKELSNLSRDELKELYKKTIANGKFSEKGGAGLGIIEMAKSSDTVDFSFSSIDDLFSLYKLQLFLYLN